MSKLDFTIKEEELLDCLRSLHLKLRGQTFNKYRRINPFIEDLFDWKERGFFWTKKKDITIYNSASVVGDVDIGQGTWIGPYCSIDGSGGLKIGRNCSIALGAQLVTHDTIKWALSDGREAYEYAPITIGNCCFIGTHAVVSKGVTIGDHCLITAGAVVLNNVEPYSIVGGVPAKKIGKVIIKDCGAVELLYQKTDIC